MTKDDSNTYKQDDVSQYVNEYAEPYVELDLKHFFNGSAARKTIVYGALTADISVVIKP